MKIKIYAILITALIFCCLTSGLKAQKLQPVFSDNTCQFTGVAVSHTGRVFVTYPRWSHTYKYAVVEVMPDGTAKPYPDAAMNSWKPGEDGKNKWVCVQTAYVDNDNFLYILDPSAPMLAKVQGNGTKLVKFDLNTNKIIRTYYFTGTTDNNSYLNDIRIDTKKQIAYITQSHTGGIVILDLKTGKSRQVLESTKTVLADPMVKFIIDGKELKKDGQPLQFNSDGIALTPNANWLYYKSINDKHLFRIKTQDLLDTSLNEQQLIGKIDSVGDFVNTDGMIFDKAGNLYMGDMINYRMVKISPDLKLTEIIKDPLLIWPDTYSIANGYLYITTSQIHKQPQYNEGVNKRTSPYMVFKMKIE